MGARIAEDQQEKAPNITITRLNQTTHTFELSSLNATAHLNVYEHELHPPAQYFTYWHMCITVEGTQIYHQRCVSMGDAEQRRDLPLVAVDVGKLIYSSLIS